MENVASPNITSHGHTTLNETGSHLVNEYGAVMKTRDVLACLDISAQTLYKISLDDLPRSKPRGRAGSTFFTMDVAKYLHKTIHDNNGK
jgi:hypothetical protein